MLLVPTFTPFFFHWKDGLVPPLNGIAVNVMEAPPQLVESGAVAITLAGGEAVTVTSTVSVLLHPVLVKLRTYLVVASGLTTGVAVLEVNPAGIDVHE